MESHRRCGGEPPDFQAPVVHDSRLGRARGWVAAVVAFVGTLLYWLPVCVLGLVQRRGHRLADAAIRSWCRIFLATAGVSASVAGLDNIPRTGSCVVFANHQSHLDGPLLLVHLPLDMAFLIKRSLGRIPLWGWAVRAAGYVPIDRRSGPEAQASTRRAAARVAAGRNLLVFPEGTRSRSGRLQAMKKGGVHLALEAGVPILPVSIRGTYALWPPDRLRLVPGRAHIHVHPLVPTAGKTVAQRDEIIQAVRAAIASALDEGS